MLESDRIEYCFSLTHELPDVEFKGPGKGRENPLFGRVVRAAMAMANRRGGGIVILGVAEDVTGFRFEGLTIGQLATWGYKEIAEGFNKYTNVPIEFDRIEHMHNGSTFLILNIHEFVSTPVMCIEEYRDKSNPRMPINVCPIVLRAGSFYIRTINSPESKEMLTGEETRALFDLANEKAIQSFVRHTKLAGVDIVPTSKDDELFTQQIQGWTGPVLEEIRSRGYWDIHIRPATFQQERLPLPDLRQLLIRASLNYGKWEFPSITPQMPNIGLDWIGSEAQKECYLQVWRLFQSGHFAAEVGLLEDWGDKLTYPYQGVPEPGEILSTHDIVFRLTEIYGLASRLATTEIYRNERSVVIDLTLSGVQGRALYGVRAWDMLESVPHTPTSAEKLPYTRTLAKEDIIARPWELTFEAARFIFQRFGWYPSDQLLATIQSDLTLHR